ncbi:MAG: methionine synthase [Candidatus Latescibacterota bacterium]
MHAPTQLLRDLLSRRIAILDGAMGSMIQSHGLCEADYRGEVLAAHGRDLKGCNDVLCLTRPALVEAIHAAYLEAGADIVETNTFNATPVSLEDYGLQDRVVEINRQAAGLARRAADAWTARTPDRPRFVAGSMGPTRITLSLSPDVANPGYRTHRFEEVAAGYYQQVRGLVEGGVDLLLAETVFDTLTLKACLWAIQQYFEDTGNSVPVVVSVTFSDPSYRTLSGQTAEAFWYSIEHMDLLAVGVNCGMAPAAMRPAIEELAGVAPLSLAAYLNAGLPNEMGEYDQTPEEVARTLAGFAAEGLLNLVGGCCGTTPAHVHAIAEAVAGVDPRVPPAPLSLPRFSGMDPLVIRPESSFTMIGERTNVTGSQRFARLVKQGQYEAAVEVARQQVEGGANVLDVNTDEGLLESEQVMAALLHRIAAEPDIARVPVMVDSSNFAVIEAGLRCLQGKGIVNSLSLKEGEEVFRQHARAVRRYGAAVVVMAFDEQGQATDVEHKVAVCRRAWRILTEEVGLPPHDVIFDPNILTVATGMEEHNAYALNYLEAIPRIKEACPGCLTSGGVSNISFSFRGNEYVRQAMHAAFLYHAIAGGLDMAIVNAGQLMVYEDIPPDLREMVEDVLLNRRPDATERLVEVAEGLRGKSAARESDESWRRGSVSERLRHALLHGRLDHLEEDLSAALAEYPSPLAVIEGPLMDGMNAVGELFGAGKMFLPQVVKSARAMKRAVAFLEPGMAAARQNGARQTRGRILLATVKGDVHDIGKNIVGVVLACNNYEVIDLGVMVPADRILRTAHERQVDIVGLSGLITPSLDEMVHVAREMEREGLRLPLLIGGATTSRKHTAVRIAPAYGGPAFHVQDASRAPGVVGQLMSPLRRGDLEAANRAEQRRQQHAYEQGDAGRDLIPHAEARARRTPLTWDAAQVCRPVLSGVRHLAPIPLPQIVPYIDWSPFFHVWELRGGYPRLLQDPVVGEQARQVYADGKRLLDRVVAEGWLCAEAVYGLFPAASEGDDIVLYADESRTAVAARFPSLRQQTRKRRPDAPCQALSDFVAPVETGLPDWVGAFAVTAGLGAEEHVARLEAAHDDYGAILLKALADRLAEALAERLHEQVRRHWYAPDEQLTWEQLIAEEYRGIRPAPGYPACPDHTDKRAIFALLGVEERTGITLTETCAMHPAASVSGLYLGHPEARYFAVGPLGRDQVEDYARRKGMTLEEAERWLGANLGYRAGA